MVEASLGSAIKYPIRDSQQQACLTGHDSVKGTPPIGSLENARHVSCPMTQCLLTRECLTTNYYGRKGNGVLWMTLNWEWFVSDFGDQKLSSLSSWCRLLVGGWAHRHIHKWESSSQGLLRIDLATNRPTTNCLRAFCCKNSNHVLALHAHLEIHGSWMHL